MSDTMATLNEMLNTLNEARVNNGKTPLASFKKSKAELQKLIDIETTRYADAPLVNAANIETIENDAPSFDEKLDKLGNDIDAAIADIGAAIADAANIEAIENSIDGVMAETSDDLAELYNNDTLADDDASDDAEYERKAAIADAMTASAAANDADRNARNAVEKLDDAIKPRRDGNVLKQPLIETAAAKAISVLATSFGNWLRANNINGKIARARLRRAGVQKSADGHYALNAETMAIASGKQPSNAKVA